MSTFQHLWNTSVELPLTIRKTAALMRLSKSQITTLRDWNIKLFFDNVDHVYHQGELFEMAKKKQPVWEAPTFAAIRFTKDEAETAKKWLSANFADLDRYLINAQVDGWKNSGSYDSEHDCYIASLTQRETTHVNYNICVTSRANHPLEALMICLYKIYVLFDGNKLPTEREDDNWG